MVTLHVSEKLGAFKDTLHVGYGCQWLGGVQYLGVISSPLQYTPHPTLRCSQSFTHTVVGSGDR